MHEASNVLVEVHVLQVHVLQVHVQRMDTLTVDARVMLMIAASQVPCNPDTVVVPDQEVALPLDD